MKRFFPFTLPPTIPTKLLYIEFSSPWMMLWWGRGGLRRYLEQVIRDWRLFSNRNRGGLLRSRRCHHGASNRAHSFQGTIHILTGVFSHALDLKRYTAVPLFKNTSKTRADFITLNLIQKTALFRSAFPLGNLFRLYLGTLLDLILLFIYWLYIFIPLRGT